MIKGVNNRSSGGLSKSTKALLIVVVAIMLIAVIFLVVRGLSNQNNNGTPVDKLTADLQISEVQIVNNTDLNVKVEKGTVEGTMQAINFIFYDENGAKILTRKILSSELEKNDFQISFRVTNTSKIKSISITPVFTSTEGKSVVGKVEDEYTISAEEYPNNNENNESNQEENNSINQTLPACTLDSDCNDNNSCTTDTCVNGNCSYTPIDSCVPCSLSSQCDDSNACTANVCSDGKCSYPEIPGCTPCGSNLNCEDNNSCTNNICFQGRCLYTPVLSCQSCTLDSECDDNNSCTTNTCSNGACVYTSVSNCKICTLPSQCDDNDSSTTFACLSGKCTYTKITSCKNNDEYCPSGCNAGNDNDCSYICGNGVREGTEKCDGASLGGATCAGVLGTGYTGTLKCFSGLCTFDTSLCVAPCTCSDDSNICTTDQCVNNVCQHTAISGCCTSASQCASGQTCTGNVCVSSSNPPSPALRTFYISPSGSDSTGNGSSIKPWKSLAYACSSVTTSGSLIHVKAGDYIETNECALAVGVSIEGEGITSHIISHYKTTRNSGGILHGTISLSSSAEGTNGNQTISNLKLDGDGLQGDVGVLVLRRSNVKIHNCTIVDFYKNGITFDGCSAYTEPSIWATGNELYNNVMSNCGDADGTWDGGGIIEFGGQNGILIHDNILTETSRGQEHNGNIIDGGYYNKGTKYYRNKSYKNDYDGDVWNFHIESWNTIGGTEIYDNEFYGGDTDLDVAGDFNEKGDYLYSWYIHDNFFTGNPVQTANGKYTIDIEGASTNDIWIYRNHFLNLPVPIELSEGNPNPSEERRIYIGYNLMEKCGWNSPEYESILQFSDGFSGSVISDVYIYNNIISGDKVTHNTAISIDTVGTISNFNVKNNIILHNDNGEFFNIANSGSINGLYVDNNLLYDNANNNNPKFSGNTINNYEFLNDIRGANPLFVDENAGNFHLQSGSPAINAGINVGLTSDYEGNSIVGLPDIGAFESHY